MNFKYDILYKGKVLSTLKEHHTHQIHQSSGVNAIDSTGEGYLILDEGEILETESESEEEEDSVAQEEGNEENEDDSTGIYSVSTVSQKNSDIGFGF